MTEGTYVITVRGVAGRRVRAALDDVAVSAVSDTTVLRRAGTDQAACTACCGESTTWGPTSSTFTWNRRQAPGPGPLPDTALERGTDDTSGEMRRHDGQRGSSAAGRGAGRRDLARPRRAAAGTPPADGDPDRRSCWLHRQIVRPWPP